MPDRNPSVTTTAACGSVDRTHRRPSARKGTRMPRRCAPGATVSSRRSSSRVPANSRPGSESPVIPAPVPKRSDGLNVRTATTSCAVREETYRAGLPRAGVGGHDRRLAAPGERHVVDHPHLRGGHPGQPLGDPPPHRRRIPRRLVHELLQHLHVPVRQPPGAAGWTDFRRPSGVSPPQMTLAPPPLVPPRHGDEHIGDGLRELTPEPFRLPRPHTGERAHQQLGSPGATKHYRASADTGSSRTTMDFDVGVLLVSAVESSGTRTLVSGK
ncbi:hypothetical protein SUDANB6_05754 [Streptomyces sp. enrichment culture]